MRLKRIEIKILKDSILSLDKNAKIYLFGSRIDDNKKGGDIDLLIISDVLQFKDIVKIKKKIFDKLEEQKIDIIINKINNVFTEIIKSEGILI